MDSGMATLYKVLQTKKSSKNEVKTCLNTE